MLSLNSKGKYLIAALGLALISIGCAAFSFTGESEFDLAKREIILRKIGHEILLQSGDSTSRVLPVKRVSETDYQIRFEKDFTFHPDSLVKIVSATLANNNLTDDYIVNVLNCSDKAVVYGYSMSKNEKDNLVPCSGRKQPVSCYRIDLIFKGNGITPVQKGYLLGGGIPLIAFLGLLISRSFKGKKVSVPGKKNDLLSVGTLKFDVSKRLLIGAQKTIELTGKESKLLLIFAKSPNTIIERSQLQKEIWEDEGVIVGRSLDMFISKLRKKLEQDSSVQLVNIHGKGYKLELV